MVPIDIILKQYVIAKTKRNFGGYHATHLIDMLLFFIIITLLLAIISLTQKPIRD